MRCSHRRPPSENRSPDPAVAEVYRNEEAIAARQEAPVEIARRTGTAPIEALGLHRVKTDDRATNQFPQDGNLEPAC